MAANTSETQERIVLTPASGLQGLRVAWGGVWSGYLVATGIFLLLTTLGLAVGVSAVGLGADEVSRTPGLGMGAALWTGITLLIALFIGGWVATRTGVVHDRAAGLVEGVLVWVLAILSVIYMASNGVSTVAGSVFGALGSVTLGVEAAAASAESLAATTMWVTLGAMVVALIAAVAGAMIGRRQVERRLAVT